MVRTSHHKAPRAKKTHPTVTYWRAYEGLVFMGALPTAPTPTGLLFLSFPPFLWPGHLGFGRQCRQYTE